MIQINVLQSQRIGLNFAIEPKVIINPNGSDINKVSPNNLQFSKKPISNAWVTCENDILIFPLPLLP